MPAIRAGLSVDGKLYAAPFYGESSLVMYRKDLFEKAGLKMPDAPTWDFIADAARKITDRATGINGICLRGKAGWGENMAFLTAMSNSFGARWFDENWKPQFDQPEWKNTLQLLRRPDEGRRPAGRLVERLQREPRPVPAGQVRHVDRRHRRRLLRDRSRRTRRSPTRSASRWRPTTASASAATGCGPGRWPSRPARRRPTPPRSSSPGRPARTTPTLVAAKEGWANVPPGTRTSLYANPEYQKAAPFAKMTLDSINSADPTHPTVKPVPYTGVQFVAIPEFQGLGTHGRPALLGGARRPVDSRRRLAQAQDDATAK